MDTFHTERRRSVIYITDQRNEPYASMPFGVVTVSYGGCGVIATYNAMISLGRSIPFSDVLSYFSARKNRTLLSGRLGILPTQISSFFRKQGYRVRITGRNSAIDTLAKSADACILFYMFPVTCRILGLSLRLPAAHFIEFSRSADGYLARNTNHSSGTTQFPSPSEYGHRATRFLPVGIFIFSPRR